MFREPRAIQLHTENRPWQKMPDRVGAILFHFFDGEGDRTENSSTLRPQTVLLFSRYTIRILWIVYAAPLIITFSSFSTSKWKEWTTYRADITSILTLTKGSRGIDSRILLMHCLATLLLFELGVSDERKALWPPPCATNHRYKSPYNGNQW